jgi:hypothetical protein
MGRRLLLAIAFGCCAGAALADHLVVTGGPALRKWENLRVAQDQHDRWWANFVRASTLRMDQIRAEHGASAHIVWMVFRPGYEARGREDRKPYTSWIAEVAAKRRASLLWFDSGNSFVRLMNSRPRHSVRTFDFFGHSNKHAFMFDYGSDVMAASSAWLHQDEIGRIHRGVFARGAECKSWGCHTGESMSKVWRKQLGVPLIGARGPTDYRVLSQSRLPVVKGVWSR